MAVDLLRASVVVTVPFIALVSACFFDLPPVQSEQEPLCDDALACCEPGDVFPCYEGPEGTEGVGACTAGEQTCIEMGQLSACEGWTGPAFEDCGTEVDENCDGFGCEGNIVWGFHAASDAFAWIQAVDVTESQTGIAIGELEGDLSLGGVELESAGGRDGFVAAFDDTGAVRFAHAFGTESDDAVDRGPALAALPDGGIAIVAQLGAGTLSAWGLELSGTDQDVLVAVLEDDGSLRWAKRFASPDAQRAVSVAARSDSSLVITGTFEGSFDLGGGVRTSAGAEDIFVAAFSSDGQLLWDRTAGDVWSDYATTVATGDDDSVWLAGSFYASLPLGTTTLQTAAGDARDGFLAKLDASGDVSWAKRFGSRPEDDGSAYGVGPQGLVATADGGAVVVGRFNGRLDYDGQELISADPDEEDMFILRADAAGDLAWMKRYGDATPAQAAWAVDVDAGGNVLVGGMLSGAVPLDDGTTFQAFGELNYTTDATLMKLSGDGELLWLTAIQGPALQVLHGVAARADGSIFVGGFTTGDVLVPAIQNQGETENPLWFLIGP